MYNCKNCVLNQRCWELHLYNKLDICKNCKLKIDCAFCLDGCIGLYPDSQINLFGKDEILNHWKKWFRNFFVNIKDTKYFVLYKRYILSVIKTDDGSDSFNELYKYCLDYNQILAGQLYAFFKEFLDCYNQSEEQLKLFNKKNEYIVRYKQEVSDINIIEYVKRLKG